MTKKQRHRRNASRKGRLIRKLAAYSVAAGASVSGELWTSAAPIYVDIPDATLALDESFLFDIDGDGLRDIVLSRIDLSFYGGYGTWLYAGGSLVSEEYDGYTLPIVLDGGEPIDGGSNFLGNATLAGAAYVYGEVQTAGLWFGVENGYIGLRLQIDGQDHFGWAHISVTDIDVNDPSTFLDLTLTVYDFGYESEPNTPILAGVPEPSSLGLLALGAAGVMAMRLIRSRD